MDTTTTTAGTTSADAPSTRSALLLPTVAGGAVALALGVYGRLHAPTGVALVDTGPLSFVEAKVWLATLVLVLVVAQVVTAAGMWGRLPGLPSAPAWLPTVHRWTGTLAFLGTLPVAYHCLWALGVQTATPRVLAHSALGCVVYGALTTKLLALRAERLPSFALPLLGGLLAAALTGVWLTSSLWFLTTR